MDGAGSGLVFRPVSSRSERKSRRPPSDRIVPLIAAGKGEIGRCEREMMTRSSAGCGQIERNVVIGGVGKTSWIVQRRKGGQSVKGRAQDERGFSAKELEIVA